MVEGIDTVLENQVEQRELSSLEQVLCALIGDWALLEYVCHQNTKSASYWRPPVQYWELHYSAFLIPIQ